MKAPMSSHGVRPPGPAVVPRTVRRGRRAPEGLVRGAGRQLRHRNLAAPALFAARWRDQAACRGTDLDLFFTGRGESAEPARQVC